MDNRIKRTERGWPAHFVGARNCLFRRNTLLEKRDRRYIVSTVGNWQVPIADETYEDVHEISRGRYYETAVFGATFVDPYWEIDPSKTINIDSPWEINTINSMSDFLANEMHEAVVREIIEKLDANVL